MLRFVVLTRWTLNSINPTSLCLPTSYPQECHKATGCTQSETAHPICEAILICPYRNDTGLHAPLHPLGVCWRSGEGVGGSLDNVAKQKSAV